MQASFPNNALRRKLRSMEIGLIFHERACLVAMIERCTGLRMSEDWTSDELAEMVISIEEGTRLQQFRERLATRTALSPL